MNGKVAIPTKDKAVDNHFGHCDHYTIYTIQNNKVTSEDKFDAPQGCGCKSNIANILRDMHVDTMLAGNMGQGAVNKLSSAGIKVVRGCSGNTLDVIGGYLAGIISDSGITCQSHEQDGHKCDNH
jgi:predicted Fe-Mo cluster-binding NifX family protein